MQGFLDIFKLRLCGFELGIQVRLARFGSGGRAFQLPELLQRLRPPFLRCGNGGTQPAHFRLCGGQAGACGLHLAGEPGTSFPPVRRGAQQGRKVLFLSGGVVLGGFADLHGIVQPCAQVLDPGFQGGCFSPHPVRRSLQLFRVAAAAGVGFRRAEQPGTFGGQRGQGPEPFLQRGQPVPGVARGIQRRCCLRRQCLEFFLALPALLHGGLHRHAACLQR